MATLVYPIRCSTVVLFLSAAVLSAQQPKPNYKMELTDRQNIDARINYEIQTRNFTVNRWVVYLPEPPELPSQTNVKVSSTPKPIVMTEKSPLGRKVRQADIPVAMPTAGSKLPLELDIRATLRARKLVPLVEGEKSSNVQGLSAVEMKYYTFRA